MWIMEQQSLSISSGGIVSLIVEIVAHPARLSLATRLQKMVQADQVWVDRKPGGIRAEWRNHARAWKHAAESDATHAVILQDDAVPVTDFRKHVARAAQERPDSLISLYTGNHRPRDEDVTRAVTQAERLGASWLSAETLFWGVGVLVPTRLISEILESCKDSKLPYDQRIGLWALKTGSKVLYTHPSLVDHADRATSVAGRKPDQGVRVAHKVGIPSWNDVTVPVESKNQRLLSSTRDR